MVQAPQAAESVTGFRFVGRPTRRADAPERLTGRLRFTNDLLMPGALHVRFVRSPHAAARVVSIDPSAALATPGVVSVLTARDLPVADISAAVESRKIMLALDNVLYAGHPVAAVLAESEALAEDGAQAVQVEYEPLPAAVDPVAAMEVDAPVVRQRREQDESELAIHGAATGGQTVDAPAAPNVSNRVQFQRGDVEAGFREADVVVEREFHTSWVHQGYLEPQSCTAGADPLGNLTVYASTQGMFFVREQVARTLGLADHQVKVEAMPVGGGFGGKVGLVEPTVAALALATGRPVRLAYTRMDEFLAADPAPQTVQRLKIGARRDGTLTTLQGELIFDAGANPGAPVGIAAILMGSTYRWEHLRLRGTEVLSHKSGTGAYRAPGAPQAAFALESLVDEAAYQLGIDPFDLRQKNAAHEGDPMADGRRWPRIGLAECLASAEPLYRSERAAAGPGEGVGVALGGWPGGIEPAAAACRLNSDGTLQVSLGSVDLTGVNTTFSIIAAEAFGLDDPAQVRVTTVDTDGAPYAGVSGGSKVTYSNGPAVLRAAQDARNQVLRIAAAELEASVDDLEIVQGRVQVRGVPGKTRTLAQIQALSGSFAARYEPVYGRGQSAVTDSAPGFAVHVARVRVDADTGRVQAVRHISVQDVGRAINPAAVEGQIHGGTVQSVGWGLFERMEFDADGTPLAASLMDYAIPKASQSPSIETAIVEVPSAAGPFGAKGVGEPPVIPGAAALANAVRAACGARVTDLPLTAERVRSVLAASHS
ncbi:MAG: xanthine dehydrogenase family protein molybdopterin-binding subunit [Chloroflexi bacterium]|nr:xanthine dehydrogenase family protein molybdopterin-binding subunit [Chloroflexota bacterium]MBV9597889.1 xanthine dehydrogenase family protein molybdopterin-binding subunit [Chloroflexota bacterium]